MTALFFGIAAFGSTMLGGLFALRLRDQLHLILGFSAGAVVAVAFFDLLPESLKLGARLLPAADVLALAGGGFLFYLLLDRLLLLHSHAHEDGEVEPARAHARAGSLSLHSFLDGVGLGFAFQVSPAVGAFVAAAVLAHDFSDGINTVSVVMRDGAPKTEALRWLMVDALAPIVGVAVTFFFSVSAGGLGLLLALFAGFFLYIGASDLVPESHHEHPTFWTTFMTLAGAAVLYAAIHFAG